jgi:uncharacterized membrane protein YeiH
MYYVPVNKSIYYEIRTEMDNLPFSAALYILDLIGVGSFAFSGALRAIRRRPDFIGMTILAGATAIGGGMIRDLLLGGKAEMLHNWHYPAVILLSALITILFPSAVIEQITFFKYFDALGLGIFSAIGATVALQNGLGFLWVLFIAAITGAGGGVVRDVLLNEMPLVLYREIYITAVALGATALWIARHYCGAGELTGFYLAMIITITVRITAIQKGWTLPRINVTAP